MPAVAAGQFTDLQHNQQVGTAKIRIPAGLTADTGTKTHVGSDQRRNVHRSIAVPGVGQMRHRAKWLYQKGRIGQVLVLEVAGDAPGFQASVRHADARAANHIVNTALNQIFGHCRPEQADGRAIAIIRVNTSAPQLGYGARESLQGAQVELPGRIKAANGCRVCLMQDSRCLLYTSPSPRD